MTTKNSQPFRRFGEFLFVAIRRFVSIRILVWREPKLAKFFKKAYYLRDDPVVENGIAVCYNDQGCSVEVSVKNII